MLNLGVEGDLAMISVRWHASLSLTVKSVGETFRFDTVHAIHDLHSTVLVLLWYGAACRVDAIPGSVMIDFL